MPRSWSSALARAHCAAIDDGPPRVALKDSVHAHLERLLGGDAVRFLTVAAINPKAAQDDSLVALSLPESGEVGGRVEVGEKAGGPICQGQRFDKTEGMGLIEEILEAAPTGGERRLDQGQHRLSRVNRRERFPAAIRFPDDAFFAAQQRLEKSGLHERQIDREDEDKGRLAPTQDGA